MYTPRLTGWCSLLEQVALRARHALEAYRLYAEERYGIDPSLERLSAQLAGPVSNICLALWRIGEAVNRGVCILGPGDPGGLDDCPAIAGPEPAIHHALEAGRRLTYLTTDLDSSLRLLAMAEYASEYKLVHVHGDNHHRLHLARGWSGVVYTSQVEAPGVLPLGGFTDGDRAVIIAMTLGAPWIRIHGFAGEAHGWYKDWGLGKEGKTGVAMDIIRYVARRLGYTAPTSQRGILTLSRPA